MRVLIIEDEKYAVQRLEMLLKQIVPDVCILNNLQSVEQATEWFKENTQPDLLFLDIQLEDGDAFSLLKKTDIRCPIVFTTAFKEFALDAFDYNSIGYLLKPFSIEDLQGIMAKYNKFCSLHI
jgi:DNA-binding LytR/AlgR family response regulator